jgi:hypothetical protein
MNEELTEHLRREFTRAMRGMIEAADHHAAADIDAGRRKAHSSHAEAMRRALMTYRRAWDRMASKVEEGNR